MKRIFKTTRGVIELSAPFRSIHHPDIRAEVTYRPNNYCGWGIGKDFPSVVVSDFNQSDADVFAETAESKLRISSQPGGIFTGVKALEGGL